MSRAATTAPESMEQLKNVMPDLLFVDISLPDRNGLELVKEFHFLYPDLARIVLSMHEENPHAHRALRAGARG